MLLAEMSHLATDTKLTLTPTKNFDLGDGIVAVFEEPPEDLKQRGVYKLELLTDAQRKILENALRRGIADAQTQNLSTHDITVKIYGRPPRSGDGTDNGLGIMDGPQSIYLGVTPEKIEGDFIRQHLARLITHECNHIERAAYGVTTDTIGASLVAEGLALASEVQAGHKPANFNQPASPQALANYIRAVLPVLDAPKKENYHRWMFGPDPNKPDEAYGGYPLGHAIVNSYMRSGHDLAETTATDAAPILAHWKNELAVTGIDKWAQDNFDRDYKPSLSKIAPQSTQPEFTTANRPSGQALKS